MIGDASLDSANAVKPTDAAAPAIMGVLFDVDGTLYSQGALRLIMCAHFVLAVAARPRKAVRDIRVIAHYRRAQEWLRGHQAATRITPEMQVSIAARTSRVPVHVAGASIRYWTEQLPLRFLPACARRDVIGSITRWQRLGVPMGVYSDYPSEEKLKRLGVRPAFRAVVCSSDPDVGAFKPHPRGFRVAAAKLGLRPVNVTYVGDREDLDALGAAKAGMQAVIVGRERSQAAHGSGSTKAQRRLDRWLTRRFAPPEARRCWACSWPGARKFRPSTLRRSINVDSVRITDNAYGQTAALRECRHCGLVFTDPLPHPDLPGLYKDMADPAYQASAGARRAQMRRLLDVAQQYHPEAQSLLDVGAATGLLLSEALARGLRADGVEPSRWCVETAAIANGVRLLWGTLEECSGRLGRYDLVMLVDVLEHVSDPVSLMDHAAARLARGGRLVIVTVDIASIAARLMGRFWWHHRPAHVCYFSRRAMHAALRRRGLQVLADLPVSRRFPLSYLCQRLTQYMPFPLAETVLKKLSGAKALRKSEVDLKLRDSRMFIAGKKSEA